MSEENQNPAAHASSAPAVASSNGARRKALLGVASVVAVAALGYGVYWAVYERHYESTDNAYVQAPMVQITAQVGGTVVAVLADDTDRVRAGQTLVKLDAADARLALDRAQAQLAQTVREVHTLYANNDALQANVRLREAEVARVQSEVTRATDDVNRRRPLVASGAVAAEDMQHAEATLTATRSALVSAQSALSSAQAQATTNRALTAGTSAEKHPNVERAAAAVREAYLTLQRMELPAPVAGQVARRSVQVGQRVAPGAPLMAVVPLEQLWVEANFKEVQLRAMQIGQPVSLRADLYGRSLEYQGRVAGLGAGTGAAFALLPAQNATGNWIKVVQRVPVRIELDPKQLEQHPLRVGLSMEVTVDVAPQTGPALTAQAAPRASGRTSVFEASSREADQRVNEIIRANLGTSDAAAAPQRAASAAP